MNGLIGFVSKQKFLWRLSCDISCDLVSLKPVGSVHPSALLNRTSNQKDAQLLPVCKGYRDLFDALQFSPLFNSTSVFFHTFQCHFLEPRHKHNTYRLVQYCIALSNLDQKSVRRIIVVKKVRCNIHTSWQNEILHREWNVVRRDDLGSRECSEFHFPITCSLLDLCPSKFRNPSYFHFGVLAANGRLY